MRGEGNARAEARPSPLLPLRHSELRELAGDIRSGGGRLHRLLDVEDLAVGPDVERPSIGEAHAAQHAVGLGDLLRRIRENRIVRFDVFGEFLVGLRVIDADGEVGGVELPNRSAALPERLAFGRSPAGERFREPREDDGALALVVAEPMDVPIGAWQVERGSDVSHF